MNNPMENQSSFERIMNRLVGPFATIFTLHRPDPGNGAYNGASEDLLKKCLDYANKKNYQFMSVDKLVDDSLNFRSPDQPIICFTLDDGYSDQATRLLPTLIDYGTSPNLFVITDFIDQQMWPWDAKLTYLIWKTSLSSCNVSIGAHKLTLDLSTKEKRIITRRKINKLIKTLPHAQLLEAIDIISSACQLTLPNEIPNDFKSITWQELRDLESKGVRIGSHTKSHIVFNSSSGALITHELEQSYLKLKTELSDPSSVFCYPLGSHNDFSSHHIALIKEAGYKSAVSTISNITNPTQIRKNPFQIQRIAFPNNFDTFVRYTSWREAVRSKLPF
ncbi:hypothetical protein GCM10011613_28850 [Cellvibrio zantedeschiae]|uniref:NodB homology domain-containing protein n=1 Tax=Cellvibrio zantedeschiae TaxID=1237077 RepID=A0ABQ3BAZ6_9GAMM|nr:polysaccharide deacetylase family protein [Cellvibrio zantedeschiae]GGY82315.1 hypothetical protein GCM10011613_28850 [Cellvibrio zantedeschiae]